MTSRSWIRKMFESRPTRAIRKVPARRRPSLEALEDRLAPAITTFTGGVLTVDLNNAYEAATLSNNGATITLTSDTAITDTDLNAVDASFATASVTKVVITDTGNKDGQSIDFAGTAAFSLSGGLDSSGVETNTFDNAVTATEGASISVTAPQSIVVSANLTGGTGGTTLLAQGAAVNTDGVTVQSGAVVTAMDSGTVTVQGFGGAGNQGNNY